MSRIKPWFCRIRSLFSSSGRVVLTHDLSAMAEYFERREREEKELLAAHPEWQPRGLRERLMARRKSQ